MKATLNGEERLCSFAGCKTYAIAWVSSNTTHPYACLNHFDEQLREARQRVDQHVHGGNVVPPLTNR